MANIGDAFPIFDATGTVQYTRTEILKPPLWRRVLGWLRLAKPPEWTMVVHYETVPQEGASRDLPSP